jgi:hypothetical protein
MAALGQLCRAGLIQRRGKPPHHAYSFKHALVRDAAYATLLKSPRQQLHAHIAQAIERLRPEIAAGQPEIVAHHFIEGGCSTKGQSFFWPPVGWQRRGMRSKRRSPTLKRACSSRHVLGTMYHRPIEAPSASAS